MSEPCISKSVHNYNFFYKMAVVGYARNTYLCYN